VLLPLARSFSDSLNQILALRPAYPRDARMIQAWRRDSRTSTTLRLFDRSTKEIARELSAATAIDLYLGHAAKFTWIILRGEMPAGWIAVSLDSVDPQRAELSYATSRRHEGQGIMTQALTALFRQLLSDSHVRELAARCFTWNTRSIRVLEKLGFARDGEDSLPGACGPERVIRYGLTLATDTERDSKGAIWR